MENEELLALKEEDLLRVFDNEEVTQKEKTRLEKEFKETKEESKKKIEAIEHELLHVEENIRTFEHKRDVFAKPVPKRLLLTYNRLRKGLGNLAIVNVKQRACGGCYQQLTSQTIQDLIKVDSMIYCPSCGRILCWDEKDSPSD